MGISSRANSSSTIPSSSFTRQNNTVKKGGPPYLANLPLLGNITFSPFAGGGNVMGAQRVRPRWVNQVFFVFPWLDMLVLGGHLIFSCNFLGWVLTFTVKQPLLEILLLLFE
jgi:hypothetical protein